MSKEAYWFKHDSNAKDDPKCIILIEELGLEGYGIFWILIETLRSQPDFRAPLRIIPAIARRHNTSTEKVKSVIIRYDLFQIDDEEFFYSESLIARMEPLIDKKRKLVEAGKRGAIARWSQKNGVANRVANGEAYGNKSRVDKKRVDKKKRFTPPSITQASQYFIEKGARDESQKFIDFYESKGWMVGKNKMKDWKAAIRNWISRMENKDELQTFRGHDLN